MSLTGTLAIDIDRRPGAEARLNIKAARALPVAQLFAGSTISEAADRMRQLFAICGHAHAVALRMAAEAADDRQAAPPERLNRQILVAAEALREHAARILLQWPDFVGGEPDHQGQRQINAAFRTVVDEADASPLADLGRNLLLPRGKQLVGMLASRLPAGRDSAQDETDMTVLGRRHADRDLLGQGLARRLSARLVEVRLLSDFLLRPEKDASPLAAEAEGDGAGTGSATLEVARGRLTHRVTLREGRLVDLQIDAPTLRNFAAGGVAENAIRDIVAGDAGEFEWQARLAILEIDPCVSHVVRFTHA